MKDFKFSKKCANEALDRIIRNPYIFEVYATDVIYLLNTFSYCEKLEQSFNEMYDQSYIDAMWFELNQRDLEIYRLTKELNELKGDSNEHALK